MYDVYPLIFVHVNCFVLLQVNHLDGFDPSPGASARREFDFLVLEQLFSPRGLLTLPSGILPLTFALTVPSTGIDYPIHTVTRVTGTHPGDVRSALSRIG